MNADKIKKEVLGFMKEGPKSLIEIFEFLSNKMTIKEIRKLLLDLEEQGFLEERHFGKEENFRVDYDLENPGSEFLKK